MKKEWSQGVCSDDFRLMVGDVTLFMARHLLCCMYRILLQGFPDAKK